MDSILAKQLLDAYVTGSVPVVVLLKDGTTFTLMPKIRIVGKTSEFADSPSGLSETVLDIAEIQFMQA